MADRARGLAPIDQGDLRASIQVSEKRTKRVARTNRFDRNTGIQIAMGPVSGDGVLNYATFVEFGTIEASPHPYMRPAWHGGKDSALEYIKANLGREIGRAATRLAKKSARAG
jgi:HK97 gp10 family phage protein